MQFKRLYISLLACIFTLSLSAQTLSDEARISLLTCAPGKNLYSRYGHTAVRVNDPINDIDIVFNYGTFDFNTEHFYWKFMRGETWYELDATPYWWFMRGYEENNRRVYEQVLNFTPAQTNLLWDKLLTNYEPQNRKYLYNFVFDNCATRPYVLIDAVFSGTNAEGMWSDYQGAEGQTYRRFIQRYTGKGSWSDFGINLVFGPKADQPMHGEERLFLPEELMYYISEARTADKRLVKSERIAPFDIKPVPWYKTWYFGIALYFVLLALITGYDRKRQKWSWGVELAVGVPYGLLLLIVTFLTFCSCHPLVGFGWRLLIIPIVHLCARLIYFIR